MTYPAFVVDGPASRRTRLSESGVGGGGLESFVDICFTGKGVQSSLCMKRRPRDVDGGGRVLSYVGFGTAARRVLRRGGMTCRARHVTLTLPSHGHDLTLQESQRSTRFNVRWMKPIALEGPSHG